MIKKKEEEPIKITDAIRKEMKEISFYVRYVELKKVLIKDIHKSKANKSFRKINNLLSMLDQGKKKIESGKDAI